VSKLFSVVQNVIQIALQILLAKLPDEYLLVDELVSKKPNLLL